MQAGRRLGVTAIPTCAGRCRRRSEPTWSAGPFLRRAVQRLPVRAAASATPQTALVRTSCCSRRAVERSVFVTALRRSPSRGPDGPVRRSGAGGEVVALALRRNHRPSNAHAEPRVRAPGQGIVVADRRAYCRQGKRQGGGGGNGRVVTFSACSSSAAGAPARRGAPSRPGTRRAQGRDGLAPAPPPARAWLAWWQACARHREGGCTACKACFKPADLAGAGMAAHCCAAAMAAASTSSRLPRSSSTRPAATACVGVSREPS
jgi:hypothetical protein